MGIVENIDFEKFPRQTPHVGRRVGVTFRYDAERTIMGTMVRDDTVEPFRTIIRLDDGRYVLATECQYAMAD